MLVPDLIRGPLAEVEELVRTALSSDAPLLGEALAELGSSRGKMVRPALCLLCAGACGGDPAGPRTLRLAASVELMHTAALVHDDIIDASPLRRGRESLNARWGDGAALLTGDWVLACAVEMACSVGQDGLLADLGRVARAMCEGQVQQLCADAPRDEAWYIDVARRKTAELTAACCSWGARLSGADAPVVESLGRFGLHFGLVFQITDDVLDLCGSGQLLGKPVLSDVAGGGANLPLVYLCEALGPDFRPADASGEELTGLLERFGAVARAGDLARRHAEEAVRSLDALPPSIWRDALAGFARRACNRDR